MQFGLFLVLGLSLISIKSAEAETLDLSQAKSDVTFLAVGQPSSLKIKGVTVKSGEPVLKGTLNISPKNITGTAIYQVKRLDTGIDLRTRHMKERYLEVEKYPEAKLELTKLPGKFEATSFEQNDIPFEAMLTLHGVKRAVTGTADIEKNGSELKGEFTFKPSVRDFNITEASFMGITMTDEVTVKVDVEGKIQ